MARVELSELQKASRFRLNNAVFCLCGPFKFAAFKTAEDCQPHSRGALQAYKYNHLR